MSLEAIIDFETFSQAGLRFNGKNWIGVLPNKKSIAAVGAYAYSEHLSTFPLSLSYTINDNLFLWTWGCPPPQLLFDLITQGGIIKAWYSFFEFCIWNNCCYKNYNWPYLPLEQTEDLMARSYIWTTPGKLERAGDVLQLPIVKLPGGTNLINRFCNPKKKYKSPDKDKKYGPKFYQYNLQDSLTENLADKYLPKMTDTERKIWLLDQKINLRGVKIDTDSLDRLLGIVYLFEEQYTKELIDITNGEITSGSETAKIAIYTGLPNVEAETIEDALEHRNLTANVRRVLELRQVLSMASIQKLKALKAALCSDGRVRGLYQYYGAGHTGRWAGRLVQPQNFPRAGQPLARCTHCGAYMDAKGRQCCGPLESVSWDINAISWILEHASVGYLQSAFSNPLQAISGCLRGLFVAADGNEFICSDYSSIEAVVTAILANELWRIEVFKTHRMIYEMSAAKIANIPFKEFVDHKKAHGEHHPMRNKIGKYAELASGYGGWINAWKKFGADKHLNDEEIKESILKWRAASPNIVEFWGGQVRKYPYEWRFYHEYFGIEGAVVQAILTPGKWFSYKSIYCVVLNDILCLKLPSDRFLYYHKPTLTPAIDRYSGEEIYQITYWGVGKNYQWTELDLYGGKLTNNIVQAVCRDIFAHAMLGLANRGYDLVLHSHDEPVAEIPLGFGSIEEFESIMNNLPQWAKDWPIIARGGWRGKRYRKE